MHPDVNQSGDGAGRVVGVEGGKHQVPGEGGIDGNGGGLLITNFSQHDHIGRLAEHGAQGRREGHADFRIHLDLVDAGHLVLDRFLDRDDFPVGLVHVVQARVERGRLSRTRRTGHQDDSVG